MKLGRSYRYHELMYEIGKLAKRYPALLKVERIGKSVEGRVIPMLIFGGDGKKAVFTGGVHARESLNPPVLLAIAQDYLCNAAGGNINSAGRVYLIPLLNPDGYEKAAAQQPLWKENANGVDLNRNFPSRNYVKKKKSGRPGSEPETKALIHVFHMVNPDGYLDYHSRGKSIYYYRGQMDAAYNARQKEIAEALSRTTGYRLEAPENEMEPGDGGGNTVHYFSEIMKKPALTIETAEDAQPFPLNPKLQIETYEEIKETMQAFLDAL